MPIDTSIYQNLQQPQIQAPNPLQSMQQAMQLGQMGMQQMQMARQLKTQSDIQDALYRNTDPQTGQLDQQGALTTLGKANPLAAQQMGETFAAHNKAQAEAQSARADAEMKATQVVLPHLEYLNGVPDDQKTNVYHSMMQTLADKGIPMHNVPADFSQPWLDQTMATIKNTPTYLAQQKSIADIGETQAKTQEALANAANNPLKVGAEELGKFNEDVNNASSRKETGALMQTRDRADRLIMLANTGAPANETPDARITRLNKTIPQLANEYSVGLASILQGGVPSDALMKETGLDTAGSKIAALQAKFTAQPTAGNQGALINAFVDAAQKMRDFSADRLGQVADRARQAYPYANKYFGKQMDAIAAPLTTSGASGAASAQTPNASSSGGLISSANASTDVPKSPAALPAGMLRVQGPDGKIYRVPKEKKGWAIANGGSVIK